MGAFIDGYEIAGPTEHELAVGEACSVKVAELETRVAAVASQIETSSIDGAIPADLRVELEMAQSELGFWRSKRSRVSGGSRQPGRDGYWLVPAVQSDRALRLANGLTDLADISASPRNMDSTLREIGLAVRIVLEEDGVPFFQAGDIPHRHERPSVEEKLEEAKDILCRLSDTEGELVRTSARYLALRKRVEAAAVGQGVMADIARVEDERDRTFGVPDGDGSLADPRSVEAWRELVDR